MLDINGALKAIGYGLLVLFFAVGVVKTCSSFADLKRPEAAFKMFIRFVLAKAAVGYGLDLMLAVFGIIQGMVATIISQSGLSGSSGATLPQEIIDKINTVGFWDSIPLWAVTLLGSLFITVLAFIMILTVYSRMFKLYTCLHHLLDYGCLSAGGRSRRLGGYRRMELRGRADL